METLKICIEKKTALSGQTYYYLYFNDKFECLNEDYEKIMEKVKTAKEVFESGAYKPVTVFFDEFTKEELTNK